MSQIEKLELLPAPMRLAFAVLFSAFTAEFAIMLILPETHGAWWAAVLDACILSVLIAPVLYLAVFRPIRVYQKTRERSETRDRAMHKEEMVRAVAALADGIELRDSHKIGHQSRVAQLAVAIGAELNMPHAQLDDLKLAARIHDIGIMAIPADALNHPDPLGEPQRSLIRSHCRAGYDLLHNARISESVCLTLLQHHERLDGSGYPQGLKGTAIAPEARIVAVADVVESMCYDRVHRPAQGLDAALREIEENRGRFYDPAAVDACVRLFKSKGFAFPA